MEDKSLEELAQDLVSESPLMEVVEEIAEEVESEKEPLLEDEATDSEDTEEEETTEEEAETEGEEDGEEAEEEAEGDLEEEEDSEEDEAEEEDSDENTLLGLDGDEEVDVPEQLKLKVGEDQEEVTVKQLIDTYEEAKKTNQTLEQANQIHSMYRQEADAFNDNAIKFQGLVSEGKAQEALQFLFEVAKIDGEHFENQYVSQLAPKFEEFMNLTPEEQAQKQAEQDRDYYKRLAERRGKEKSSLESSHQLKEEISKATKEANMSLDEYENLQKELLQLVDQGRLDKKEITPKYIVEQHRGILRYEKAFEILKEIDPGLVNDKVAVDHLVSLQINKQDITDKDLKARAEKAFADAETSKIQKRVKKNAKATKAKKLGKKQRAAKSKVKTKNQKALTFNDLDLDELANLL